jgi:hypothetical protein
MQIPILNGIYTDVAADFRSSYPRNMVPVPKETGVSQGYLRSAGGVAEYPVDVNFPPGISSITGPDRGAIVWNGSQYRVFGQLFCRVNADNTLDVLAEIAGDEQVTLDYSFDRLGIASGGNLYYWDGATLHRSRTLTSESWSTWSGSVATSSSPMAHRSASRTSPILRP